jgi:large subunit ribosomal protein L9
VAPALPARTLEARGMKVVFLEEVPGTAIPGEVKDVKDGFARNYLLPRKLAEPATKAALQRAEALAKREEKRQAQLDNQAQQITDKLEGQQIVIRARAGEQGRLYGSVTTADIAVRLDELLGEPIDRRRILLGQPLRDVGTHRITLRLTRNVSTQVEVVIEADETTTRGRRSTAPAGGSIIMVPRRERRGEVEAEEQRDEFDDEIDSGDELPEAAELTEDDSLTADATADAAEDADDDTDDDTEER